MLLQKQHLPTSVLLLACGPITWDLDAGGSGIQGHPWLHSKIETSISFRRPYLFDFFFFFFLLKYMFSVSEPVVFYLVVLPWGNSGFSLYLLLNLVEWGRKHCVIKLLILFWPFQTEYLNTEEAGFGRTWWHTLGWRPSTWGAEAGGSLSSRLPWPR